MNAMRDAGGGTGPAADEDACGKTRMWPPMTGATPAARRTRHGCAAAFKSAPAAIHLRGGWAGRATVVARHQPAPTAGAPDGSGTAARRRAAAVAACLRAIACNGLARLLSESRPSRQFGHGPAWTLGHAIYGPDAARPLL